MIICCGEALIDMLPTGCSGGDGYRPHTGGSVFNTAIALGRLDVPVGLISGMSRDLFGDRLRSALDDSGVDHGLAVLSDRPTTLAFVNLVDGQASYSFYDEGSAGRMLAALDLPEPPEGARAYFFGGISLSSEPCGSAYEAYFERVSGRAVTMMDINVRPAFVDDEPAYRARLERMVAHADIVKISDEDLRWLTPGAAEGDTVRAMLDSGAGMVLVTRGSKGCVAHTMGARVEVAARVVEVVDTVGAGDTFNAGVLCSLNRQGLLRPGALADPPQQALRNALELGVRAAAVTVGRAGANPPRAIELDQADPG
ncbi:MAG: carbohydrate kinase family protein [Gammaproteobacteria bacterium]